MAMAISKLTQLSFRWSGSRIVSEAALKGYVCGHCQRQRLRRSFHQSARWHRKDDSEIDSNAEAENSPFPSKPIPTGNTNFQFNINQLDKEQRAEYETLSPAEQQEFREEYKNIYETLSSPEAVSQFERETQKINAEYERDMPHIDFPQLPRVKPNYWTEGEIDREASSTPDEYEANDLNELGHAELEYHRELRQYARIAAWEMPLLSKFAKPFKPPNTNQILRFRYTTYMGEQHPAAKKIVLEFCPTDLPDLSAAQRLKLIKLVGPRYNPETDTVKMSSEMFETQAQNKRYLGDLVDTLIREAKDSTDMFEDVPLDFRHHRPKKRFEFPEAWKLTPERRALLEGERNAIAEREQQKMLTGAIVDGSEIVEKALAAIPVRNSPRVLENQPRGGGKSGARRMLW